MRDWIAPSAGRPSASLIYNKIIDCITKPLSIKTIWNRELSDLNLSVNWERVWSNLSLTSKNLKHLKSFQISGQCPDFNTRFNNFRIVSFNLELLCFSISLDIPSKPQDFKIFKDLILPISSFNDMGLSKCFSHSLLW